jgi:hypothetical protein
METDKTSTPAGREAARELQESANREERRVEERKGDHLKKGEERVEERSRSSDGRGVGEKQRDG